jgi:UDP-N-acetylmuramoyl-tripeptide--D-alanyl-D-alanine ligase
VDLLVTVGDRAAWAGEEFDREHHHAVDAHAAARLLDDLLRAGDTVLVKGSRGVGLEVVTRELAGGARR